MLGRLDVRAAAAYTARDAQLLLVVVEGGSPLPNQVKRWLEECLGEERKNPLSMVLLNGRWEAHRTVDGLSAELANLARRMGVELIYDWEFEPYLVSPLAKKEPFLSVADGHPVREVGLEQVLQDVVIPGNTK